MKILQLNKSQEKKLLSLCKEFFPEYSWDLIREEDVYDSETGIDYNKFHINMLFYCLYGKDIYSNSECVHFYQLCLTELPKRIMNNVDKSFVMPRISSHYNVDILNLTQTLLLHHPVDFLHNFVKECKKNKYFKTKNKWQKN